MASLRQDPDTGIYRIRFRFEGRAYNRSLKTTNPKTANSILSRTEETIRLIEHGRLEISPKTDPATFILSDGKQNGQPKNCKTISLKCLFKTYQTRLPEAAKKKPPLGLRKPISRTQPHHSNVSDCKHHHVS